MDIKIMDINSTLDEMIEVIEENIKVAAVRREEINKLKLQTKKMIKKEQQEVSIKPKEIVEKEPFYDADFEEEMEYYLIDYNAIKEDNLEESLESILPSRKNYRYKDIIYRLISESFKEIKEITELILNGSFEKEDIIEMKKFISLEQRKIELLKQHLKTETKEEIEEEKNNEIVLIQSLSGNIKIIDDLERIHPSFYASFLELIESIKSGTFKGVKRFTNNMHFAGLSEVRAPQVRIAFARINKNTYALITAFTKKCDNDKGYRDSLIQKLSDYRIIEPKLQELLEDEEFQKENALNVERLYALLGKVEEDTLKEVL